MRKLLRHGRNSKPSSGGSMELIAVGDYLTFLASMEKGVCTLYEPNDISTTFYNWYEGDGVDVYLFGTFSSTDIQSLKVYVDDVLSSDTFSDSTSVWETEMPVVAEDFDIVLDAYVMNVPVDGQYHTITVKTSDNTVIHTYNVRLFAESGDSSSTGTVYKVYAKPVDTTITAEYEDAYGGCQVLCKGYDMYQTNIGNLSFSPVLKDGEIITITGQYIDSVLDYVEDRETPKDFRISGTIQSTNPYGDPTNSITSDDTYHYIRFEYKIPSLSPCALYHMDNRGSSECCILQNDNLKIWINGAQAKINWHWNNN